MMQKLGFSYDAPEAREEENIALAEEALALEQKLGTATTFAEDIPQAILTVITATKSDGGLSSTMAFSLISSCSASAYVVYDLAYKNLWNPETGALIALFDATGGSTSWKNCQNWKSHKPISEWFGVEVDERGRVVKLALASNGLRGERLGLSRIRVHPTERHHLLLTFPVLAGELPKALDKLANLTHFIANDNSLSGPLSMLSRSQQPFYVHRAFIDSQLT